MSEYEEEVSEVVYTNPSSEQEGGGRRDESMPSSFVVAPGLPVTDNKAKEGQTLLAEGGSMIIDANLPDQIMVSTRPHNLIGDALELVGIYPSDGVALKPVKENLAHDFQAQLEDIV